MATRTKSGLLLPLVVFGGSQLKGIFPDVSSASDPVVIGTGTSRGRCSHDHRRAFTSAPAPHAPAPAVQGRAAPSVDDAAIG